MLLGVGADWMEDGFSTPADQIVEAAMATVLVLRDEPSPLT